VTEPKTPLDERALDGLMLGYRRGRRLVPGTTSKATVARKVRDNRQRADLAHAHAGGDDEVA
jgi:hypothetical protein